MSKVNQRTNPKTGHLLTTAARIHPHQFVQLEETYQHLENQILLGFQVGQVLHYQDGKRQTQIIQGNRIVHVG